MYTSEEKERIIRHFKKESQANLDQIKQKVDQLSQDAEQKILRRLNTVTARLWKVRIKDVLLIERQHKPDVKNLLFEIKALEEKSSFRDSRSSGSYGGSYRILKRKL